VHTLSSNSGKTNRVVRVRVCTKRSTQYNSCYTVRSSWRPSVCAGNWVSVKVPALSSFDRSLIFCYCVFNRSSWLPSLIYLRLIGRNWIQRSARKIAYGCRWILNSHCASVTTVAGWPEVSRNVDCVRRCRSVSGACSPLCARVNGASLTDEPHQQRRRRSSLASQRAVVTRDAVALGLMQSAMAECDCRQAFCLFRVDFL